MHSPIARILVAVMIVGVVFAAPAAPVSAAGLPGQVTQTDRDRAKEDEQRKRQEDRSAKRFARDQKQSKEILDEIQPDLDALAVQMIDHSYDDRFLQDYVNELGQSLIPKETPADVLFSFRVVNDRVPNAFAMPDGRIYVSAGLLVFAQNEAQLAFVLGHEIGHVLEDHYVESVKASRSFTRAVLPGIIGGIAGAAVGGMVKGKEGAAAGAAIGIGAGAAYSIVTMNRYNRKQEDEADRMGVTLAMNRGFDPKEAIGLYQKLVDTYGEQDRLQNFLWADHSRNTDRVKTVNALLDTQLSTMYNAARTSGNLTVGSGELYLYASRMIRDVAVWNMEDDRYRLAKSLLDGIIDYRAKDPKTLWALGRVYKTVGRTDADRSKALDYLQRAVAIDERNMYPYVNRELGLAQARLGRGQMPAAIESLKKYIRGHIDKYGTYPKDIEEMYDYLLVFGDSKWTAPKLDPVVIRAANPEPVEAAPLAAPAPVSLDPSRAQPKAGGAAVKSAQPVQPKPAPAKKPAGRGGQQ
jgi:predicted Zn-dependent protease